MPNRVASTNVAVRPSRGFTIIELLVAIAVIGILAGLTAAGYGAWRKGLAEKSVKSDLAAAAAAMENAKNWGPGYPNGLPATFQQGRDSKVTYRSGDNGSYCIDAVSSIVDSISYHIDTSAGNEPVLGTCAADSTPGGESPGGGSGPIASNGGVVTTLAGSGTAGYADGVGTAAQFRGPVGVAVDGDGNVYVAEQTGHRIRKISSTGVVTNLAGSGTAGYADGLGAAAQFNGPTGIAVDAAGTVYVADQTNHRIRKVSAAGVVSTLAGSGTAGYADGVGTAAQFKTPTGLAVETNGTIYVTESFGHRIRKVSPTGVVTTLAGSGTMGYVDGSGTTAQFAFPWGVAVDASGTVYVADYSNYRIRKISPTGVVSTLAGSGTAGYADGSGTTAQFALPYDVAVDAVGTVYVADQTNHRIRKVSAAGVVSTLAGSGTAGYADGSGTAADFNRPIGLAVDASGTLYVADSSNQRIRKIE